MSQKQQNAVNRVLRNLVFFKLRHCVFNESTVCDKKLHNFRFARNTSHQYVNYEELELLLHKNDSVRYSICKCSLSRVISVFDRNSICGTEFFPSSTSLPQVYLGSSSWQRHVFARGNARGVSTIIVLSPSKEVWFLLLWGFCHPEEKNRRKSFIAL